VNVSTHTGSACNTPPIQAKCPPPSLLQHPLAQRLADTADFTRDLQTALTSRGIIDQAIGAVMQQMQCTEEEAFDVLRRLSQETNIKFRDVCTRLMTDIAGQPPARRPPLRPGP
jgi:hypothetical protein